MRGAVSAGEPHRIHKAQLPAAAAHCWLPLFRATHVPLWTPHGSKTYLHSSVAAAASTAAACTARAGRAGQPRHVARSPLCTTLGRQLTFTTLLLRRTAALLLLPAANAVERVAASRGAARALAWREATALLLRLEQTGCASWARHCDMLVLLLLPLPATGALLNVVFVLRGRSRAGGRPQCVYLVHGEGLLAPGSPRYLRPNSQCMAPLGRFLSHNGSENEAIACTRSMAALRPFHSVVASCRRRQVVLVDPTWQLLPVAVRGLAAPAA